MVGKVDQIVSKVDYIVSNFTWVIDLQESRVIGIAFQLDRIKQKCLKVYRIGKLGCVTFIEQQNQKFIHRVMSLA